MMKSVNVINLEGVDYKTPLSDIALKLDDLDKHEICYVPWPEYDYTPEVHYSIAHSNKLLFIKYYVKENMIRASYTATNDPVYLDSCVECFIGFEGEEMYYNFEFNCIGTCLGGYGRDRNGRQLLPVAALDQIRRQAVINNEPLKKENSAIWELTLVIPVNVFCYHNIKRLGGLRCRANFFKCGDGLPNPHYLTWSPVSSERPDFHLPAYFGALTFV